MRARHRLGIVGTSVPRKDGRAKVTGEAVYVADLAMPGALHGLTIRSTVPCGEIAAVRLDFDTSGFTVVRARDIPGANVVALIEDDQPCLAEREVRHYAEPILLVAHEDPERLLEAAARVRIEYRPRHPVYEAEHAPTVFKRLAIDKGSIEEGFRLADEIVEGEYRVPHQEQLYIETNGMVAVPGEDSVTVFGSLQCPYYVRRALSVVLGIPADRVRVVQAETGGGFGGKEEYPSLVACHAALLARASGRPVRMIYDRAEDMVATTKRHPGVIRHRTGVARDGRLTAMDIDVLFDGGAYATLSAVVLSRGVLHATGPYRCDHVRVRGRVVMTNTPPNGAFRGFGAPQTQFATEVQMDRIAERLGVDPVRIREVNALRPGDTTATGQRLGRDASALPVLREAVRRSGFRRRRRAYAGTRRGIGLSLYFHGAGFTGAGEVRLASKAALELTTRGARIRVASAEIGQGARTVHAQIVAETLGVSYDAVEVARADTSQVPDSGPTVASRTAMVVGGLLQRCAAEMKARLGGLTPRQYLRTHGDLVVTQEYVKPADITWDEDAYRGEAYGTYGWGCDVVEVELDPDTYQVKPLRATAVVEVGRVLNPVLARGQVEGGTLQGLGYALMEQVVMRDGRMANADLTNYLIPTTMDTPPIDVAILERPYLRGPFGAKGLGELPMDGPAPAAANALRSLGLDVREIPATPERLMELTQKANEPEASLATDRRRQATGRSRRLAGRRDKGRGR